MTLSPDARVRAAIRWVARTRQEVGTEPFDDHRDLWTVALVDALAAAQRDAAACEERLQDALATRYYVDWEWVSHFDPDEPDLECEPGYKLFHVYESKPMRMGTPVAHYRDEAEANADADTRNAALAATPPPAPLPTTSTERDECFPLLYIALQSALGYWAVSHPEIYGEAVGMAEEGEAWDASPMGRKYAECYALIERVSPLLTERDVEVTMTVPLAGVPAPHPPQAAGGDLAFWQEEAHAASRWLRRLLDGGHVPAEYVRYVEQFANAPAARERSEPMPDAGRERGGEKP